MRVLKSFSFVKFGAVRTSRFNWAELMDGKTRLMVRDDTGEAENSYSGKYFVNSLRMHAKKEGRYLEYNFVDADEKPVAAKDLDGEPEHGLVFRALPLEKE